MSSGKETDDTDQEICELLDPTKIAELELSKKAEMDSDLNTRPERKRNIVKRQISFNKKALYRYVPLGSKDSNPNLESGTSSATSQDPFKILVCDRSGKQSEVDLNCLITITSSKFSCRFKGVVDNIIQTWKNICDLQPQLDETVSAFKILSPESLNQISQKASKDTNENSEGSSSNRQDLKEILPNIPLQTVVTKEEDSQSPTSQNPDVSEGAFSSDTVKNILDLPRRKVREKSFKIDKLNEAKTFNQLILFVNECQEISEKVESKKCSSTATSSSSSETEIQSTSSAKVEVPPQKEESKAAIKTVSEASKEKIQVRQISINSPFGQILSDALAKLDKQSSQAESLFQSILDNLFVLPFPGDHASSEATIKSVEYNLNHRLLQFRKDVPKLQRNVINFFNRIECLVRKWPLNTSIRTLKQYLAFVIDVNSKVVKFNLQSLMLRFNIESERLISLSGRPKDKMANSDCLLYLYKKYYMAVKYISALEELRGLSEKFYSYIVKPLPSFLV